VEDFVTEPFDINKLAERCETFLRKVRYESAVGRGNRGLMEHHIQQLTPQLVEFVTAEAEKAMEAEREGCANICDNPIYPGSRGIYAKVLAAAIRARKP
jgi:hypothetical protein